MTKVNDGLNLAGAFEIRKAYLKLNQAGTIKKTVTRIPLAVKQTGITSTSWQDVADPILYEHQNADFEPQPTVYLRSTGIEVTSNQLIASLHVRLVRTNGFFVDVVEGSTNTHTTFDSVTSYPLELEDGTYQVQVKVTMLPQIGDLYSAELVFEQDAGDDPDGLTRSVTWFPGVTAPVDLPAGSENLRFPFRAPTISAPEVRGTWIYAARRVSGSGEVKVDLRDVTASAFVANATLGVDTGTYTRREQDNLFAAPPPGNRLDSRTDIPTGTTGRISGSALKIALDLREDSAPIVTLSVSEPAFSPNGDDVKDFTWITVNVIDVTFISWELEILDQNEEVVRTMSGDTRGETLWWYGEDDAEEPLPDGLYQVRVAARDVEENLGAGLAAARIDTQVPALIQSGPTSRANVQAGQTALWAEVFEEGTFDLSWTVVD